MRRSVLFTALVLCLLGAICFGSRFFEEMKPRVEAEGEYQKIRSEAFPDERVEKTEDGKDRYQSPDFKALHDLNPDIIAWIYGPGTGIDYPVVQGTDNEYYLNHTVDKKANIIGSIFMEAANQPDFSDEVTILYGHHIKAGRMFSSLSGYKDQSYYEKHPEFYIFTPKQTYRLELFAGNVFSGDDPVPIRFSDGGERRAWLKSRMQNSTFYSRITPGDHDRIVGLCTCTYEYTNARYIIYGILNPAEEETCRED